MAQSAIAEMANMITSKASTVLSGTGLNVSISPPTLITGENVTVMVSQVKTICIEIITEAGTIEVNVGWNYKKYLRNIQLLLITGVVIE